MDALQHVQQILADADADADAVAAGAGDVHVEPMACCTDASW